MTDSTPGAVAIMRFQAAVAAKDIETFLELLSDQCVLVILNKNQIYVGKDKVMEIYHKQWFDINSKMKNFTVIFSNTNGIRKYNLNGMFEIDGCCQLRKSKISFIVEDELISGIVRESTKEYDIKTE